MSENTPRNGSFDPSEEEISAPRRRRRSSADSGENEAQAWAAGESGKQIPNRQPAGETAEAVGAAEESGKQEPNGQPAVETAETARAAGEKTGEPALQAADSRVPPEARRMSASPYGTAGSIPQRRPGTRPPQAFRRPAQPAQEARTSVPKVSRPTVRPEAGAESPEEKTAGEETRSVPVSHVSVGYAPGRMSEHTRIQQEYIRNTRIPQEYRMPPRGGVSQDPAMNPRQAPGTPGNRSGAQGNRFGARMPEEQPRMKEKRHPVLTVLTLMLLAVGLTLIVLLALPKDHSLRSRAEDAARTIAQPVEKLLEPKREAARVFSFSVTGNERNNTSTDVIFSVTTESAVTSLRLVDEDGQDLDAELTQAVNTENTIWTLTFRVLNGYEGVVRLQTLRDGEDWAETDYSEALNIPPSPAAPAETPVPESTAEATATPGPEKAPEKRSDGEQEEAQNVPDAENGETPEGDPGTEGAEAPENKADADGEAQEEAQQDYGDDLWGNPWGGTKPTETPTPTPAPTETPEPTPEPTPTPPLTAAADPNANPDLITTTVVYDGSKKVKSYMRAAKSLIHMPDGDNYTSQKIGVLTFRGTAFRQNAAVGTVVSAEGLTQIWQTEAGSLQGAKTTYYGYEWTGQPAIVKWSTQVRAASNLDEEKKTKTALREVIIAGVDGVIRFLDLEDGSLTRSAINLRYPFKGSPSLHPAGYPYMSVGQYDRKMKNRTGSIGLREYNLYTQKEQKLIDGLDGKLHRGYNRIGSFETSALIDRTSDTMITLGTNGLLYLTSLNTSFDYQAGTLSISPGSIVMASKAKGQKKTELMAVESSHAMYDRYVFYADMGGVLRCVDTNFLTPVWAVETGDAVMAAIALDLNGDDGLDLYTANMLKNRKSGNAQIRRYDALSGKLLWTTEIGVAKNTKTKEDVGVKASPVIGQNTLAHLVYFTVTGLNADGCATLGVGEGTNAALVAMEKETGKIRWALALSDRSESSPVAVYDAAGNGWIIQCAEDGKIFLVEGLTGRKVAELQIEGKIKASPAVYNDIMVIGTTGKGTEFVYGIRVR